MPILEIPVVIGTYAKIKDKAMTPNESSKFRWSCIVALGESRIQSSTCVLEKVEFRLHNSFANPLRSCSVPPYAITEEGWGEFNINIEIFYRQGGSVKVSHYLKLNGPGEIVVNERFDTLMLPISHELKHPPSLLHVDHEGDSGPYDMEKLRSIPIFDEYLLSYDKWRYNMVEESFINCNQSVLIGRREHIKSLIAQAIAKEEELCTVLNNRV